MYKFYKFFLLFIIVLTTTKADPILVITENLNNVDKITSASTTVPVGSNLTITCQTSSLSQDLFHDELWTKEVPYTNYNEYKLKWFWNNVKLKSNEEPFKIEFKPVSLNDQGTYVCSSKNYRLYKKLKLIVRKKYKSRKKRAQYNLGVLRDSVRTQIPPIPDPAKDYLDGLKKNKDPYWSDSSNNNKFEVNFHTDLNWNQDDKRTINNFNLNNELNNANSKGTNEVWSNNNNDDHPVNVGESQSNYNIFYFVAILISFVLILFILCVARRDKINQQQNQRRVPTAEPPCNHHVCAQYRANDPTIGCYLASINSSNRRPEPTTTVHRDSDGGVTITTNLMSSTTDATFSGDLHGFSSFYSSTFFHNGANEPDGASEVYSRPDIVELESSSSEGSLDLPPTYTSSVKKGKSRPSAPKGEDLPPSYSEAVRNNSNAPRSPSAPQND